MNRRPSSFRSLAAVATADSAGNAATVMSYRPHVSASLTHTLAQREFREKGKKKIKKKKQSMTYAELNSLGAIYFRVFCIEFILIESL